MKNAMIRNNMLLLAVAFILFFAVAFFSIYKFEHDNQQTYMTYLLEEVEQAYENYDGDIYEFVADYDDENRRITILDENGLVLVDSHDLDVGTDKSARPEIVTTGKIATRTSNTIGVELVYIATQVSDGNYLRVSIPMNSQVVLYERISWILAITSIIIFIVYYYGLKRINQHILSPLKTIQKGLVALNQGQYQMISLNSPYQDINELIHEMNLINLETSKYLRQVESYQHELDVILNQMKQGVMLINDREEITYFNKDASKIFHLDHKDMNQPLYQKIRQIDLKEAIAKTNETHQDLKFDMLLNEYVYEIKTIPLDKTEILKNNPTVLVRIKDVTKERQLMQMKRDFFSYASHELKSPLTAISGTAELIEYEMVKDQKDIIESAKIIHQQAMHMSLLVEDMLMLTRLEQISNQKYEKHDLKNILNSTIEQLNQTLNIKNISIDVDAKKVFMKCDPLDIQKLFKNLIENACKYSENDKKISVKLYKKDDEIHFDIKDQGYGIGLEHQQRVFERFYRVDKGRLDGGTGLGLAIVKHIVIKYKGKIDLQSQIGKGTEIRISMSKNLS